jgi:hypothetical protein
MVWNKQCDTFADDLDAKGISCEAYVLHNAASIFCNRMGTDGRIPRHMTRRFYSAISDVDQAIADLLAAGLWVETDDGYEMVDFLVDQDSAEMVRHRQQRKARNMRDCRARQQGLDPETNRHRSRDRSPNGHHTQTQTNADKDDHVTGNVTGDSRARTRPAPPRPEGEVGAGATASDSPGGSPSPRPAEEETTHLWLNGLECFIRSRTVDGSAHGGPHTCVEFWAGDEGDGFVDEVRDSPAGQQMAALHKAVYDNARKLGRQQRVKSPRADSAASLAGVEIVVPDDQAATWLELLAAAVHAAEVEELAGQLAETLEAL